MLVFSLQQLSPVAKRKGQARHELFCLPAFTQMPAGALPEVFRAWPGALRN